MVFNCKVCGGSLEIEKGQKIVTCAYCGVQQTLPRNENDKITNLYDRANHFLRNNEYDKAEAIYETILTEDSEDAEAYWSLVLCKYGVEYVKDPKTDEYVPTCNRTKTTSILVDEDYKQALEKCDEEQKKLYISQATQINEIQKRILALSSKEEKYDVFICYKEKDKNGERTQDSVLAQDIYTQLINEGLRVFFARITLEDKIGMEYEPYIYAALNSAKVMIVLGTNKEHFEAPWVRNEWSRYLSLTKENKNKTLIPCYKDMDAYDLPEEFAHLQAQDMGKIGFLQDLVRGIKKLTITEQKENATNSNGLTEVQKEDIYKTSKKDMQVTLDAKILSHREKAKIFYNLEKNFERLGGYLDSNELAQKCNELYQQEKHKKNVKNIKTLAILTSVIIVVGTILLTTYIIPNSKYNVALNQYNNGEYYSAIKGFHEIPNYKDSKQLIEEGKNKWKKSGRSTVAGPYDKITAVKAIGTVYNLSSVFNNYTQIADICNGDDYIFLLKEDGTVQSVKNEREDIAQLYTEEKGYSEAISKWTNIVTIKASDEYVYGLKNNGTVLNVKYRKRNYTEENEIKTDSWNEIVQIQPCLGGIVGIKEDGTLVQSGVNYASISKIESWKDIVQLTGSEDFLVGLKEDGTLVSTGGIGKATDNETNVIQLSNNQYSSHHFAFIKQDGTVKALGNNDFWQCNISEIDDIVFLHAGDRFTVGITRDKRLVIAGAYEDQSYSQSMYNWSDIKTYEEWRGNK